MLSQTEYHTLRAGGGVFHVCSKCGRCEIAGGFCSTCLSGEYDLTAHRHVKVGKVSSCPLARVSVSTFLPRAVLGVYHHQPGASTRRFSPKWPDVSEATLAVLTAARQTQRSAAV